MTALPSPAQVADQALPLFEQAFQRGWLYRLSTFLFRRSYQLKELGQTLCCARVQNSAYAGAYPVEIKQIQGTENKAADFDGHFHPRRQQSRSRWLEVAVERLRGRDLPPVELVEVDGIYYVRDGHHRISVARTLGQQFIDAEVIRMSLDQRDF